MLTAIYFVIILLGLLFRKSKTVRFMQYACVFVVFVFNSWNQDDVFYRGIYIGYYGASHEPGFDLLCQLCYKRGIAYETFRMYYVAIAVILLLIALNKIFKDSANRAYSMAMLYPLLPFVELLRNFMAMAIVTNGIAWYFSAKREKLKEKIIFALVVLLGATFHYNVLFNLILLLPTENWQRKHTYRQIVLISLNSILACNIPVFRRLLSLLFNSEKVMSWFKSSSRIGMGIFIVLAFHIISFLIFDGIYKAYQRRIKQNLIEKDNLYVLSERMYAMNIYSFALLGLYTYNMEFFSRLYVFVLLLNCFYSCCIATKIKAKRVRRLSHIQVLYHIGLFLYFCQPFNPDGIMSFVLQNNMLFP